MRATVLLSSLLLASGASASWFSSEQPEYTSWNADQLKAWLNENSIQVPKGYSQEQLSKLVQANWYAGQAWTEKQLETAKEQYGNVKDAAFDTWSESQLRDFLVKQGVVAPSGPREQLVLAANKQYRAYNSAASSLSRAASTAIYGDEAYQATKSGSSLSHSATSAASSASSYLVSVAKETAALAQAKLDDTKDYVYSTWSDNELRSYLEEKGVIKTKTQATRDELLAKMKESYASVANPVWEAWSDSSLFNWLHDRGLVRTDYEKKRDKLTGLMQSYYYTASDTAYSQWSDSELKSWLVEHDIIKSDAQLRKEKMQKLVADNYAAAHSTIYGGWKDSDMRAWLIDHGYLRSDAQVKRDELYKLMSDKYTGAKDGMAAYLTWPDARLRAYLRSNGVDESYIPGDRPGLLQETRIRWVQANNTVDSLLQRIREAVSSGVEGAEAQLGRILESITGTAHKAEAYAEAGYEGAKASGASLAEGASASGASLTKNVKAKATSLSEDAKYKATSLKADAADAVKTSASNAAKSAKSVSSSASKASKSAKNEL